MTLLSGHGDIGIKDAVYRGGLLSLSPLKPDQARLMLGCFLRVLC